ncbi:MAG: hypothetical protein AAFR79_10530 [Pseudomonadota bacterium]
MTGPPAPPIEPMDLRSYPMVLLDRGLLKQPAFADLTPEAHMAQIALVFSAWEQVPACSVPDHPATLALMAGLGRDVAAWSRVSDEVLSHWQLAEDGRLYFPPMFSAADWAFTKSQDKRSAAAERARRAKMRKELLGIGVELTPADLETALPIICAKAEERCFNVRGQRRREILIQIVSELKLLPDGSVDTMDLDRRFRGPRQIGAVRAGRPP